MSMIGEALIGGAVGWGTNYLTKKITGNVTEKLDDFVRRSLDHVKATVEAVNTSTSEAIRLVVQDTAQQLTQAIEGFKDTYQEALHLTFEECGQGTQNVMQHLIWIMNEATSSPTIEGISKYVDYYFKYVLQQQIPYVRQITPLCIADSKTDYDVNFKVTGVFSHHDLDLSKEEEKITLSIGGRKFYYTSNIGNLLTFFVPFAFLSDIYKNSEREGNLIPYDLSIPYIHVPTKKEPVTIIEKEDGQMVIKDKIIKYINHKSYFLMLPEQAGVASIDYEKRVAKEEKKELCMGPYHQSSRLNGGREAIVNRIYTIEAEDGYKIDPGSVQFKVIMQQKNSSYSLILVTEKVIKYSVSTHRARRNRHSGELKFQILYTASRIVNVIEKIRDEVTLEWGQIIPLKENTGAWRIQMSLFDGSFYQIDKEDVRSMLQNPFATILSPYRNPALRIATPEEVNSHLINQRFIRAIEPAL
ncbi:MAG: hypothetical protein QRY71_02545 [Candidatus Rhabdochlamydia sp.]